MNDNLPTASRVTHCQHWHEWYALKNDVSHTDKNEKFTTVTYSSMKWNNTDKNDKGEDDGVKNDLGEGEKMDDGEGVDFLLFANGSTSPVLVELRKTGDI